MNEQKEKILKRIDELIDKKREELLKSFISIHELNDGIILRSFNGWDNCDDNNDIKYKIIPNRNDSDELTIFSFIPKDAKMEFKTREYIQSLTMLSGKLELSDSNGTSLVDSYSRIVINNKKFGCVALEDTYALTSNRR